MVTPYIETKSEIMHYQCSAGHTASSAQIVENQALVVKRVDSTIHWINHNPLDNSINFNNTYLLDNDLSSGYCCPPFEPLGPDGLI